MQEAVIERHQAPNPVSRDYSPHVVPTLASCPQVPELHSEFQLHPEAGRHLHHHQHCQQCGWATSGLGLCPKQLEETL